MKSRKTADPSVPRIDEDGPPAEPAGLDAFISYTRHQDDIAFVDAMSDALGRQGKRVWLDRHSIEPAADWRERIARGIAAAKALIFVVSPESLVSTECAHELGVAVEQSKLIIPVIFKDVDPHVAPEELTRPNWIYWRHSDDGGPALEKLIEALDADLGWRDAHARLGVRSQEWLGSGRDKSFLLRGNDLRQAEAWYAEKQSHKQQPTDLQYSYIAASRRAATRRQGALLSGVAVALVLAVVLAVIALVQRNAAVDNQHVAQSRQLAAQSTASLVSDPGLSALYSLKALSLHYSTQAENALRNAAPELQLLRTFSVGAAVHSVEFDPSGSDIVTTSLDGKARIWNTTSGRLVRTFTEPAAGGLGSSNFSVSGNGITFAAFSRDGAKLVTASEDTNVRVWDVRTGAQLAVVAENGIANQAVFSADGSQVLVASDSGTADLWDIASQTLVRSFGQPASQAVESAQFSPNGQEVVTASAAGTAQIWDEASGVARQGVEEPLNAALYDASFSADGSKILTASADGSAREWDAATGTQVQSFGLRSGQDLRTARFSPNNKEVVTAGSGAIAGVWDVSTGEQLTVLAEPLGGRLASATFSPDGTRIATADNDGTARIWDASPRELVSAVAGPGQQPLHTAAFNPSGSEFVAGGSGGVAGIWRTSTGQETAEIREGFDGSNFAHGGNVIEDASFNPSGSEVVTASSDGTARIWNATTGQLLVTLDAGFQVYSAAFSPDGTAVMTANNAGNVEFWDPVTGRDLGGFTATNSLLFSASFSPDGRKVVTALDDGTARVWDVRTGKQLVVVREPESNPIGTAVFSPDGKRILTASDDGRARVWDATTGKQLLVVLQPQGARFWDATFSHDGKEIVTAGGSGDATVWDAVTGKELTDLGYAQGATLYESTFSPDGKEVLTAGYDGLASVWSATLAAPLERIEKVVTSRVDTAVSHSELQTDLNKVNSA